MNKKIAEGLVDENGDLILFIPPAPTTSELGGITLDEKDIIDNTVGKATADGGEIFNDYDNNIAFTGGHAEGLGTVAGQDATVVDWYSSNTEDPPDDYYNHAEGMYSVAYGAAAHAEGLSSKASGLSSHAEGWKTTANAWTAHAEGANTTASGEASHAEGIATTSSGFYSHAEGYGGNASGQNSHIEGSYTTASKDNAHAEGQSSIASGINSHAEGANTTASGIRAHAEGFKTESTADSSHAEGSSSKATINAAHAEGYNTTASGWFTHSEGNNTVASGSSAHAEGGYTTANGAESHSSGLLTIASSNLQTVLGKANIEDTLNTYIEIAGNGTATWDSDTSSYIDITRSNAYTLDWSGNGWFAGNVYSGTDSSDNNKLTTKEYVDTKISNAVSNGLDASAASANQVPLADGSGTWTWNNITELSNATLTDCKAPYIIQTDKIVDITNLTYTTDTLLTAMALTDWPNYDIDAYFDVSNITSGWACLFNITTDYTQLNSTSISAMGLWYNGTTNIYNIYITQKDGRYYALNDTTLVGNTIHFYLDTGPLNSNGYFGGTSFDISNIIMKVNDVLLENAIERFYWMIADYKESPWQFAINPSYQSQTIKCDSLSIYKPGATTSSAVATESYVDNKLSIANAVYAGAVEAGYTGTALEFGAALYNLIK